MTLTANKNARELVTDKRPFKGSNTFAETTVNREGDICYKVYSYGYHFPIYAFKNAQWYKNKDRYSVSTSRHQSQLRPIVNDDTLFFDDCIINGRNESPLNERIKQMLKTFTKNLWEYEVTKAEGYGYQVKIFKNIELVYSQAGFGAVSIAEVYAQDYFLLHEFDVEREDY